MIISLSILDGQPAAKHNKACYDFISTIDQTGMDVK